MSAELDKPDPVQAWRELDRRWSNKYSFNLWPIGDALCAEVERLRRAVEYADGCVKNLGDELARVNALVKAWRESPVNSEGLAALAAYADTLEDSK